MTARALTAIESIRLGDHPRYAEHPAVRGQVALVRALIDEIDRLGQVSTQYAEAVHDQLREELARLMRIIRATSVAA